MRKQDSELAVPHLLRGDAPVPLPDESGHLTDDAAPGLWTIRLPSRFP